MNGFLASENPEGALEALTDLVPLLRNKFVCFFQNLRTPPVQSHMLIIREYKNP